MSYHVLLFDLFGTLVLFKPTLGDPPGADRRAGPVEWLREPLQRDLPGASFDDFLAALLEVTREIVRLRPPEYREVVSPLRFQRALDRLGLCEAGTAAIAERLCRAHMEYLAAQTEMPDAHRRLLQRLRPDHRLGLISNFDHAPTARSILRREGIADLFDVTLISGDFGRRKPHRAIFQEALRLMDADRSTALYVGDTIADDVCGAHGAAIDVVWINRKRESIPQEAPEPTFTIERLTELESVLGRA